MNSLNNPTRRRALHSGAAALGTAFVAAPVLAQNVTRLKIQTAVPSSSIYYDLMKRMADRVDKMSAGRLKLEMLPDGAVVAAFEIVDAVDKGVVDGGYAWTHYWSGKNTAAGLYSNPAAGAGTGMDQLSHVAWLFQGGGYAMYKRFYSDALKLNIEPFMVQPMGPDPLGWFKNPINSLEDMKKLKYRSPPGLVGEIFKEMGINAVAMPGAEIVPAAQRGVLDAAEWIGPADDMALGFHNVFKHYYLQGLHHSTDVGEMLLNLLHRRHVDQRSLLDTRLQSVSDLERAHCVGKFVSKGVEHAVLHKDTVGADAGLTHVAELGEHRAPHRRINIGVIEHDERRVSAELH